MEFAVAASDLAGEELVFVDEMGINTDMARRYGRALPGIRVVEKRPVNTPPNTSVIGALGVRGMITCLSVEGAIDSQCFCQFIEQMLVPQLQLGQVVLMDNVSTHKSERVAQAIEGAGAGLVYLPAYSPDFNPIEECWSKIKESLRAGAARTKDKLMGGLTKALATITLQDILGWFNHSGYYFSADWHPL